MNSTTSKSDRSWNITPSISTGITGAIVVLIPILLFAGLYSGIINP
jgi:hypothetical protein